MKASPAILARLRLGDELLVWFQVRHFSVKQRRDITTYYVAELPPDFRRQTDIDGYFVESAWALTFHGHCLWRDLPDRNRVLVNDAECGLASRPNKDTRLIGVVQDSGRLHVTRAEQTR